MVCANVALIHDELPAVRHIRGIEAEPGLGIYDISTMEVPILGDGAVSIAETLWFARRRQNLDPFPEEMRLPG
jgi:hypothetical protein